MSAIADAYSPVAWRVGDIFAEEAAKEEEEVPNYTLDVTYNFAQ